MSPKKSHDLKKKYDRLITDELKIKISQEMVEAFMGECDEKGIWFTSFKWGKKRRKQALKAKKHLEDICIRDKDRKKPVVKFEIVLSCSCYPKLDTDPYDK